MNQGLNNLLFLARIGVEIGKRGQKCVSVGGGFRDWIGKGCRGFFPFLSIHFSLARRVGVDVHLVPMPTLPVLYNLFSKFLAFLIFFFGYP